VQVRGVSATAPVPEAQPVAPTLEDVYLYLVNQPEGSAA